MDAMFSDGAPPSYEATLRRHQIVYELANVDAEFANDIQPEDLDSLHAGELDGELQIDSKYQVIIDQDEYIKKQIVENYPLNYIICDCLVMFVLNVSLIVLQVLAIQYDAALSYIGSAIWAGLYNLLVVALVLLTIKYRNPTLMMTTNILKLFGMIVSFCGFILVHMVAFYHYNCMAGPNYRPCYNQHMKSVHYAIIILGAPCLVMSVAFFLYFQFKLMGRLSISTMNYHMTADN